MKLFLIHQLDLSKRDGIAFHIIELAKAFEQCGVSTEIIAPTRGKKLSDIPVKYLPMPGGTIIGLFIYEILLFLYLGTRKTLWSRTSVFYIRRGTFLLAPYFWGRLFGVPVVLEENGLRSYRIKGDQSPLSAFFKMLVHFQYRAATHIIAVSQGARLNVLDKAPKVESKVAVVPNGVNMELFRPLSKSDSRKALGLPDQDNEQYICFIGNFYRKRGVQYLVEAMPAILQHHPKARLLLVGDGEMRQELEDIASELKIQYAVIFTGFQPYDRLPLYIGASDVCVAPYTSSYSGIENSIAPLKLYAYMAGARPIVMTDVSVEMDDQDKQKTTLIVPPDNAIEIANAVNALLNDQSLAEKMGQFGRRIIKKYSWQQTACTILDIIG